MLEHEFRILVQRYLSDLATLADVRGWLEEHVIDLYDGPNAVGFDLANVVWTLIGEHDAGDRSEPDVRRELARSLAAAQSVRESAQA